MSPIDRIRSFADDLTAIRRDIHAHPEIGFEEVRTSNLVAEQLQRYGIEVHRGLGGTGVVGVLQGRSAAGRRIGLRAEMDALPIEEETNLPHRSTIPGKMHACGHDGHTTMLLGAARYLAETRDFDGTACSCSSRRRKGSAAPAPCWPTGCSSASPATRSTGSTTPPAAHTASSRSAPGR